VQVNVFTPRELRMEASANLQQGSYAPADLRPTARGLGDPRQDLQECTLPRTVASYKTDNFALFDFERKIFEGPESIRPTVDPRRSRGLRKVTAIAAEERLDAVHKLITKRIVTLFQRTDLV